LPLASLEKNRCAKRRADSQHGQQDQAKQPECGNQHLRRLLHSKRVIGWPKWVAQPFNLVGILDRAYQALSQLAVPDVESFDDVVYLALKHYAVSLIFGQSLDKGVQTADRVGRKLRRVILNDDEP